MKRIILLFLALGELVCFAQSTDLDAVKAELDAACAGLDKTKVSTGYLWDVSVNLVEADLYNGNALLDSNYVNPGILGDMLCSINSASVGGPTLSIDTVMTSLTASNSGNDVQFGILFQKYNF